ncbi:MAG: shikimate dehydrogenase [Alphaproteobacteria bacterium]
MSILKKAAVMGWPIEHSLSPKLHQYWLTTYKSEGSYEALAVEPEKLKEEVRALAQKGFAGVNLTVPHKEAALKLVDRLDEAAIRVGAVNTIVVHADGTLEGRNTDVYGFMQNLLAAGTNVKNKIVVVLGAGGAARAAIVGLQDAGAKEIRLINRTSARAALLAKEFGAPLKVFSWGDDAALDGADLLINATSLGLKGQPPLDIKLDHLPLSAVVTDMVYVPLETDLIKRAKARGHKTIDGLGMLLHQARPAFHAFFGVDPDVTLELRQHVLRS